MPFTSLLNQRQENLDAINHTPQVHAKHPLPVGNGQFFNRARYNHASIVVNHMNSTKAINRCASQRLNSHQFGYICWHTNHFMTGCREFRDDRVQCRLFDVCQHDFHTFLRKSGGCRPADTARRTRNHRNFARKFLHICVSSLFS